MAKIRPFNNTESDYQALFNLIDATWTDEKVDVESFMHSEQSRNPKYYFGRLVAEVAGQVVGSSVHSETWWTETPDEYRVSVTVLPEYRCQGIGAALYERSLAQMRSDGHQLSMLRTSSREDQTAGLRFAERYGFALVNRYPRSELRLESFAADKHGHYLDRMAEQGIVIKPLSEVKAYDPDWQRKIYELEWIFEQDEPTPDPPTKMPFDEWLKQEIENPQFMPSGWAIALDGERYAGMSCLWPDKHFPDRLHTGWTGVDRPYRKRGVATALKVKALAYARAYGATHIRTDNHEENWMFQINLKLGFQPIPAWVSFKKEM